MEATLLLENLITVFNVRRWKVALGAVFGVELTGIRPGVPVDWQADNDEVLSIEDDAGLTAKITAAAVGKSTIELQQRGHVVGSLRIEVFKPAEDDQTVTVGMSFGNVRPVDQP